MDWYRQIEKDGGTIKALENCPLLYEDLRQTLSDYLVIRNGYHNGWSTVPVPMHEYLAFMEMFEISDYLERKTFLKRMKILDRAYLEHHSEANKNDRAVQDRPRSR